MLVGRWVSGHIVLNLESGPIKQVDDFYEGLPSPSGYRVEGVHSSRQDLEV